MKCMKCGKDLKEFGVFCSKCQDDMEPYPVKSGTPIQLPPQTTLAVTKRKPRRRSLKPEEQISRLRTALRLMAVALLVALAALAIVVFLYLRDTGHPALPSNQTAAAVDFECFT